jgi:hypothetical protein
VPEGIEQLAFELSLRALATIYHMFLVYRLAAACVFASVILWTVDVAI